MSDATNGQFDPEAYASFMDPESADYAGLMSEWVGYVRDDPANAGMDYEDFARETATSYPLSPKSAWSEALHRYITTKSEHNQRSAARYPDGVLASLLKEDQKLYVQYVDEIVATEGLGRDNVEAAIAAWGDRSNEWITAPTPDELRATAEQARFHRGEALNPITPLMRQTLEGWNGLQAMLRSYSTGPVTFSSPETQRLEWVDFNQFAEHFAASRQTQAPGDMSVPTLGIVDESYTGGPSHEMPPFLASMWNQLDAAKRSEWLQVQADHVANGCGADVHDKLPSVLTPSESRKLEQLIDIEDTKAAVKREAWSRWGDAFGEIGPPHGRYEAWSKEYDATTAAEKQQAWSDYIEWHDEVPPRADTYNKWSAAYEAGREFQRYHLETAPGFPSLVRTMREAAEGQTTEVLTVVLAEMQQPAHSLATEHLNEIERDIITDILQERSEHPAIEPVQMAQHREASENYGMSL